MTEAGKGHHTRARILDAAGHIAARQGMSAVTVRAVSEAAGVGMGTLRHHFPSQRDMFAALVSEVIDDRLTDEAIMDESLPGPARLERAIGQFLPEEFRDRATLTAWFDVYATAFAHPPSDYSRQLLESAARRSHRHVRGWLAELAREGWLPVTHIELTADMLISLSSGLLMEALSPGSPVTFETAKSTLGLAARRALRPAPRPLGSLDTAAHHRFTAPAITLPVTARQRPDRAVYVSNESDVFQVYAWDRREDLRWAITTTRTGRSYALSAPTAPRYGLSAIPPEPRRGTGTSLGFPREKCLPPRRYWIPGPACQAVMPSATSAPR